MSKASKKATVKSSDPETKRLEALFQIMEKHQVAELEWEKSGERIKIALGHFARYEKTAPATGGHAVQAAVPHSSTHPGPAAAAAEANRKPILSPFVGTFYRAPAPGADSYVKEGQLIKRGDVLCVIEAMKLMNEIEAELSGRIVSVLVENGQPVEFGEPLFLVEPS